MKNVKKILIPVGLAVTMSLSAFLAACGGGESPAGTDKWHGESIWLQEDALVPTGEAEFPEDVGYSTPKGSVHDPSIFHDPQSGYYYAYGTHYAVARTYEFENAFRDSDDGGWEQVAGDDDFTVLYGDEKYYHSTSGVDWPMALKETVDLVNPGSDSRYAAGTTTWAPDVEYIGGKYYMYYSLTRGFGSRESAIGRVESDSPTGPFANNKQIIDSIGGNGDDPNCIDPELFYDEDGKLWMVYGSASGGIYIKELYTEGDKVGLPKEDGFGKRIWKAGGGAGANEEGPFVFYNASTKYYYLMTSHGSLMANYNMHVARSQNPDGPYVGIDGKNVAEDGDGNLVAGNFKIDRAGATGLAAMGHNSVIKDKSGKYYVIYHTRTISSEVSSNLGAVNQGHNLYVSQMYFNEAGWPVMAPTAYAGETRGTMTEEQVAKQYDIVIHAVPVKPNRDKNEATFVKSAAYTLTADGKVTGAGVQDGDGWTLKNGYYIELTLKGITYKGVVAPGWDTYTAVPANQKAVVTFTAVSDAGLSLWAVEK